ncbi:hypothetical protein HOU03_gp175 [Caulobacter phage CcrSC]|uniref:Uncharacterized protein n=1 Tax=Caulobacter phage CcrSC TaxID=2283272 RepID=A0A385EE94_9CAUD|nr:hypothetical protein HOU03_gp011 [Caulobacter phage CcrSC]YP_009810723.1 hypothetical protein HOU03_gp175 [Caulobacter phage CcrSC]AXQ69593.1 hypothetical protein CcrSC_gp011 [Caulobacter phage CcrSC]AXQ70093.1 hypothetical protein CcrSC_gp511 [Caulobacter phage CcrSC]
MKRRHALFLSVIASAPDVVILQAPAHFLRWSDHRKAILAFMRQTYGVKAADVHAVEGVAGYAEPDPTDDPAVLARFQAAFAGSDNFPKVALAAWDGQAYRLVRRPLA